MRPGSNKNVIEDFTEFAKLTLYCRLLMAVDVEKLNGKREKWWKLNFFKTSQLFWEARAKDINWNEQDEKVNTLADNDELESEKEDGEPPMKKTKILHTDKHEVEFAGIVIDNNHYEKDEETHEMSDKAFKAFQKQLFGRK